MIAYKVDSLIIAKRSIPLFDNIGNPNKNSKRFIKKSLQNKIISKYMKDPSKISEDLDVLDETDLLIIAKPRLTFSEKEVFLKNSVFFCSRISVKMLFFLTFQEMSLKF